jgi:type VI secretion system lysozyme-like protein
LVDLDPRLRRELRPRRALDRNELRESVRRELGRLLNTRCPIPARLLKGRQRTVIDYGIPDFGNFSPRNPADRQRLARLVTEAIECYEPRLQQVRVELSPSAAKTGRLEGWIEAILVVDEVAEPISFPTIFQNESGEFEIDESR